jgi:hypothetical protein
MKVLIAVKEIPIGSTVTKKNGEKVYTVRDKIQFFGEKGQVINPEDGTRFLVAMEDISIVSGEKEVLWDATPRELYEYIQDKYTRYGEF